MQVDVLVIGQGLAGSLLARRLAASGTVAVVDPGRPNATQVAAGLMTPLTGRRFRLTSDYPRLFARAAEVYGELGVFQPVRVYRMFADAEQRAAGVRRSADPDCAGFVERVVAEGGGAGPVLRDGLGGVLMRGAWVDLPRLLSDTREWLGDRLIQGEARPESMSDGPDAVRWQGVQARFVVWCDGWRAMQPGGLWSRVPWQPAKGEALDLRSDAPDTGVVLNRDGWAMPHGPGAWRTGTNWDWDAQDEVPTPAQRDKLLARFHGYFAGQPRAEVTAHVAGVRPCTPDSRPCIGRHRTRSLHYILNGLGPRGTVWAPTAVDHLEALLRRAVPVPAELDVARLLPA